MPRMIDLIRASAVSANIVQAAARGALVIPGNEMIEILVYLAKHNKVFGQQARMTLAGWDEKASLEAASNPKASPEVLEYLIEPDNLRPKLLPALLENPSVPEKALLGLAVSGSREVVDMMLSSPRVHNSPAIRQALASNPNMTGIQSIQLGGPSTSAEPEPSATEIAVSGPAEPEPSAAEIAAAGNDNQATAEMQPAQPAASDTQVDEQLTAFFREHATEIDADAGKPFRPIGGILDELATTKAATPPSEAVAPQQETSVPTKTAAKANKVPVATKTVAQSKSSQAQTLGGVRRGGALQKISQLDIKGRIQLAMKGNKEERSILIRDGTKIVALAVLESAKITDSEVEGFASQKNVLEAVLRAIPMKRRFAKHYAVIRNLVFNPRTPLDVSLGLMKNMLVNDLRNLSSNKEVSDTIRKLALKMFKQKADASKKRD